MTRRKADSTKLGYGVARRKSDYLFRMPRANKGYFQRAFTTLEAGKSWQLTIAKVEWGLERFSLIKRGRLAF